MKMKRLAFAIATIGYAGFVMGAANAADEEPKKVERIEVTGSSIKRVAKEGPAPVETISRKQIEKTGATTVNELLKSVASIDIFDQGELASNSPSGSGTANVRMRGMSENEVLVLLNGKRLPRSGLADSSGAGDAVDINMIPISAIERVEILKDGGSAIYGADAVAGVVNFITKKNYQGAEATARGGITSKHDGRERGASLTGGYGDFDEQGFNVMASLDVFRRDPILRKDRDLTRSVDFRRFGGNDRRSSFSPYGNIIDDATGDYTGATVKPCPPELYRGRCRYDFNADILTAYNGADRMSFLTVGALKLSDAVKATGQFIYAENKDHFDAHPVPDYFLLPDGTQYAGRFMQGGPRQTDRKGKSGQGTVGLEGAFRGVDWKVSATAGQSKSTLDDKNYYNRTLWDAATLSGALDATSLNNDPALVESLKVSPHREGTTKHTSFDAQLSGEAFQLPGGPLGYAVGASRLHESLKDTPDELSQQGLVVGSIKQAPADASRNAYAVFGEVVLPVWKAVEVQAALRYDHYSTATKTSPKVAVSYRPVSNLLLRSSYTESFKMPGLKQLYGAAEQGAITISGADQCAAVGRPADCDFPAYNVNGSNPDLKPEKGKTYNIGAVLDAGPFSGSLDFWRIRQRDVLATPSVLEALQSGAIGADPVTGRMVVFTNLRNIGQFESQGIDLDASLRFKTEAGVITLRDAGTYYDFIKQRRGSGDFEYLAGVYGTAPTARWRNNVSLGLDAGIWSTIATVRTVSGLKDTSTLPTVGSEMTNAVHDIPTYSELDLGLSYSGIKSTKLDFGIKNVADRVPPFSHANADSNANTQMGFAELYSIRGRFFYASANYKFK